jgi:hypothetical protein
MLQVYLPSRCQPTFAIPERSQPATLWVTPGTPGHRGSQIHGVHGPATFEERIPTSHVRTRGQTLVPSRSLPVQCVDATRSCITILDDRWHLVAGVGSRMSRRR